MVSVRTCLGSVAWADGTFNFFCPRVLGYIEIIIPLEVHPELAARSEITGETERCIRRDTAAFIDDFVHARHGYPQFESQLVDADTGSGRKSSRRASPGCNGAITFFIGPLFSMVIHDFHIAGLAVPPCEADAVLAGNPDGMTAFAVALQGFERHSGASQIAQ